MGIGADDFVFTLVSRPLKEKGWEEAAEHLCGWLATRFEGVGWPR